MKFKDYITLNEVNFNKEDMKYLVALLNDIEAGKDIKIGNLGEYSEKIEYSDELQKIHLVAKNDFNKALPMLKSGKFYKSIFKTPTEILKFNQIFKGSYSGFNGKSLSGAEWEKVIIVAHNMYQFNLTEEEAIIEGEVSNWTDKFSNNLDVGIKIVKSANMPKVIMKHFGAGGSELTPEWDNFFLEMTGKKAAHTSKTPKTDMYLLNGTNISLKKEGGSQLMSGGKAESLATIMFAYDNTPNSVKDSLFKKNFDSLTENVINDFGKFNNIGTINDIKKDIKRGKKSEIINAVKRQLDKNDEMRKSISMLVENSSFKEAMVKESMTGNNKFKHKLPKSTHIMVFNESGKSSLKLIDDKIVSSYALKTKFDISMKSASGNSWTALKGIVSESNDDFLLDSLNESIREYEIVNEKFGLDSVKYIFNKGKELLNFVKSILSSWIQKIFLRAKESFSSLLSFIGMSLSIELKDTNFTI